MTKMEEIFKKHKKRFLIGAVVLALIFAFFIFGGKGNKKDEGYVVSTGDVIQSVVLSGKVMTSDRADLGFASGGRLASIFVKNNQQVESGQILAQLEIGDLLADLKIKQANSRASDIDLVSAKEELEKVTIQENTKVESAYRSLLSEDLELVPVSNGYDTEPPTVSGVYDGVEGRYKVTIKRENATLLDFTLLTFGLEKTKRIINDLGHTPLGTRGLFISFDGGEVDPFEDTSWYLDIPNKSGASYLSNLNAYNEAESARDLAIKDAKAAYEKLLTEEADGSVSIAEAEVQKINSEIRKNTIYAPFKGKVTNLEKEVGENASVGERIVSMVGEAELEVVLQVSELDVSRLTPGNSIKISLDAFPGEEFTGILKTVNSRDKEVDGVPVYEAFVELAPDPRIKTGMSATGTIVLARKDAVITVPSYLIKKVGNSNFVEVILAEGKKEDRQVTLGLLGTDNMVEILSGLSLGEKISSSIEKK